MTLYSFNPFLCECGPCVYLLARGVGLWVRHGRMVVAYFHQVFWTCSLCGLALFLTQDDSLEYSLLNRLEIEACILYIVAMLYGYQM